MNVLIFPSWYTTFDDPLSGVFFREQVQALHRAGVNLTVFSMNVYGVNEIVKYIRIKKKKDFYIDNGVKTYIIYYLNIFPKIKLLKYIYSAFLLKKNLRFIMKGNNRNFDLVHIHSALDAGIIYYLSKFPVIYILTEHSSKYSKGILSFLEKKLLPKVFSSASNLIAVGVGLKKSMEKYTDKNINVVFNLVSMDSYSHEADMNKEVFRFFSLGCGLHTKGFDILISAFGKTNIKEKTELFIAGLSRNEINELQALIDKNNLKNITLLGVISREEVANFMNNCDCFVLPSRFETFGVVFAEAMFFGKPVIASMTGGPDSFVTPETGLLVPVDNIEETASALEHIYYNKESYDAAYIAKYAKENFSGEVIAKKIMNIYREVINAKQN